MVHYSVCGDSPLFLTEILYLIHGLRIGFPDHWLCSDLWKMLRPYLIWSTGSWSRLPGAVNQSLAVGHKREPLTSVQEAGFYRKSITKSRILEDLMHI